jgi:hypothetical protein
MREASGYSIREVSSIFRYLATRLYHLPAITRFFPLRISVPHILKNELHEIQPAIVSRLLVVVVS